MILVTIEAACSSDFLMFAQLLIAQQKLDRIVFEECHLTITMARFREPMAKVGLLRVLRTQFVYLTATLPPDMQAEFEEQNHLLRPIIVRASSNRPNIFYMVRKATAYGGSLLEQSAKEVKDAWFNSDLFYHALDKVVIYVRTRKEVVELSHLLDCEMYTSESGTVEEKEQTLQRWTRSPRYPFLVATTALAEGFDYPHVRLVFNVDEPDSLIIFAQQSGRAGRDGRKAYSFVLLPVAWKARQKHQCDVAWDVGSSKNDLSLAKQREREAVHRYLKGEQCFRTSLSEYLDALQHRRWCMSDDVPCDVCKTCHEATIPPRSNSEESKRHTGAMLVQKDRLRSYDELAGYQADLVAVRGTCLLCRALGLQWDHSFSFCTRRHEVFAERRNARQRVEARGKKWLRAYTACYWCLNPQVICPRADPNMGKGTEGCEFGDLVLPVPHGVFRSPGGSPWLSEEFGRHFTDIDHFYDWLGEESKFGGTSCIQAVRVAAKAIAYFRLS